MATRLFTESARWKALPCFPWFCNIKATPECFFIACLWCVPQLQRPKLAAERGAGDRRSRRDHNLVGPWPHCRAGQKAARELPRTVDQRRWKGILELPSLEAEDWSHNCWHCWGPRAPAPSLIAGSLVGTKIAAAENQRRQHMQSAEPWTDRKTQVVSSTLSGWSTSFWPLNLYFSQGLEAVDPACKPWGLEVQGLGTAEEPYSWFPIRASAAGKKLIWIRTKILSQVPSQVPRCCIALVSFTLDFLNVLDLFALKD